MRDRASLIVCDKLYLLYGGNSFPFRPTGGRKWKRNILEVFWNEIASLTRFVFEIHAHTLSGLLSRYLQQKKKQQATPFCFERLLVVVLVIVGNWVWLTSGRGNGDDVARESLLSSLLSFEPECKCESASDRNSRTVCFRHGTKYSKHRNPFYAITSACAGCTYSSPIISLPTRYYVTTNESTQVPTELGKGSVALD